MLETGNVYMAPSGINCIMFAEESYLQLSTPDADASTFPGATLTVEPFVPFLIDVPSATPALVLYANTEGDMWTYPVTGSWGKVKWNPMLAPGHVGSYAATTTPVIFDLGVTSLTEVYLSAPALIWVSFGSIADDLSAAPLFPIYPSAPMRFRLGNDSRRMVLKADVGTTTLTMSYIGRAS